MFQSVKRISLLWLKSLTVEMRNQRISWDVGSCCEVRFLYWCVLPARPGQLWSFLELFRLHLAPVSWFASYCFHSYFPKQLSVFALNFVTIYEKTGSYKVHWVTPVSSSGAKSGLERESLVLNNNKTPKLALLVVLGAVKVLCKLNW